MTDKIKVLIVDDSAVVRETLSQLLSESPEFEVVGTASDPYFAAERLRTVVPDVITLDIEMPRMDGLSFLRRLMQQHPLPVVICSSVAEERSQNALAALDYGAVEIIEKPKVGTKQFLEESRIQVYDAIRAAHASRRGLKKRRIVTTMGVEPKRTADVILSRPTGKHHVPETTEKLIVVGASTGGTEALREFLEVMPLNCPGIVIVQHRPEKFTAAFANRLNGICEISVKEAQNNDSVITGHALIAPGNKHMLLKRSGARYYVEIKEGPLVSRHRPSVDVLFRSAAHYAGTNAIGVIMTGMGDDGARGMAEMHEAGAYTIAQDEETCVVYGMPQEAVKHGGVDESLPLPAIAGKALKKAGVHGNLGSGS